MMLNKEPVPTEPVGRKRPMSRLAKLSTVGIAELLLSLIVVLYVRQLEAQLRLPSGMPLQRIPPECEPIELSGTLRRPGKSMPVLDLVPGGGPFKIGGALLDDLPAGTLIRVKGVVRSRLLGGGTVDSPSASVARWKVYLLVTELEILDDPTTLWKRKRDRQ